MAEFDPAFHYMLPHEGGFQNRVNDKGNWTGGEVGKGELRGTKFGISAASYPDLDIQSLTIDQAHDLYLRDWWNTHRWAELFDQRVASKIFDHAIENPAAAHKAVQLACIDCGHPVMVDGVFGTLTVRACNAIQPAEILEAICGRMEQHFRVIAMSNPLEAENLEGWIKRARAVPQEKP